MSLTPGPTIRQWNHILALASDTGPCGKVLSTIEARVRREAARREDTWDFLLGRGMCKEAEHFCRAAKSADYGARWLNRVAAGTATTRRDDLERLRAAIREGDKTQAGKLAEKVFRKWELAKPGYLETLANPEMRAFVHAKSEAEIARLGRRLGTRKAHESRSKHRSAADLWASHPREMLLVTGWLRLPYGDPGLCFFTKTALAWLFHHLGFLIPPSTDPTADARTRLRRLGLIQAQALVTGVTKTPDGVILLRIGHEQHPLKTPVKTGPQIRYCGFPPSAS